MPPALADEFSTTGLPGKSTQLNNFILAILFCPESISNQECTLKLLFFSHLEEFLLWGVIQFELSPKLICFTAFFILWLTLKFWILWDCKELDTTEQLKHTHTHFIITHIIHMAPKSNLDMKLCSEKSDFALCLPPPRGPCSLCPIGACMLSHSVMSDSLRPHGAYQAPLSMGFSRKEYWTGLHALLDPGIEPVPSASADGFFTAKPLGSPIPMGNHF